MAGALWYDYMIARPAVEDAYARIAQLNSDFNTKSGKSFMTNLDVQKELQRSPIESFAEGGYFIEVYGWRAGLPVKSHKYFAVYTNGSPKMFLKHYMTELDLDELRSLPLDSSASTPVPDENAPLPVLEGVSMPRPGRMKKTSPGAETDDSIKTDSAIPKDPGSTEDASAPKDANSQKDESSAARGQADAGKGSEGTESKGTRPETEVEKPTPASDPATKNGDQGGS
jgi:hypothetical protein